MNKQCRMEMEELRKKNNGFLRPQDVVEFARNEQTELHNCFEWDNSTAAAKYRLQQAMALIRFTVIVEPVTSERTRAYVSLTSDRNSEGGYRAIVDILNDEALKELMLQEALKELASFQKKYSVLRTIAELGGIFTAIEDILYSHTENRPLVAGLKNKD